VYSVTAILSIKRELTLETQTLSTTAHESKYLINPSYIEETGRSSAFLARDRRCPQCLAELKKSKGASSTSFINHRKTIAKCCSKKDSYLKPEMPLMEVIFRILLSGPAKGMSHTGVFKILSDKWANQKVPKNLSNELVRQIANSSGGYGVQTIDNETQA